MKIGHYTIEGYSASAFATYIGVKELDILFDIGHCPPHFIRYNNLLISHGHQDHLLSITRYVGLRNMNNMPPARIFLPAAQLKNVQSLFSIWAKIENRRNYEVHLIPVEAGDSFELNDRYYVRTFKTNHSFDSMGFLVYEKRKKLKPEFAGLSGEEIVQLKKNNVEVEYFLHIPQVCYTGDTTENILDEPLIREARYLIIEATFLTEDHLATAEDKAHIHLQKMMDFLSGAPNNYIILTHFSMRYHRNEARNILQHLFGDLFENKIFMI